MAESEPGTGYGANQRLPSELDKNRLPGDPAISTQEAAMYMQPQAEYTPAPDDLPPDVPAKVAPLPKDPSNIDRGLPETYEETLKRAGENAKAMLDTIDLKSPHVDDGLPPHEVYTSPLPPHDAAAEAAQFDKDLPK